MTLPTFSAGNRLPGSDVQDLADAIAALQTITDTPSWSSATLANSWTGTFKYRRLLTVPGAMQLHISITPGTKADGTTITTLPAGSRPTSSLDLPVAVNAEAAATGQSPHLYLGTDGVLNCWGLANTTVSVRYSGILAFDL